VEDKNKDTVGSEMADSEAKNVGLNELSDLSTGEGSPFDVMMDIPVMVTLEVGGTSVPIRNLLQLSQGSVIQLDRMAGEALDVKVNGRLIAHGEVVVVDDRYGIRLTDIISPEERVKSLT
jgi:flagellar motor switch protein FliN/FliY